MTAPLRVDFHCHSSHSDGSLSPKALADQLAVSGVAFAALTDHDTMEGFAAFRKRLARHGIGCLSGVEITTRFHDREAHLLAYGVDPHHPELRETLAALRHSREPHIESIAESLRRHRLPVSPKANPSIQGGQLDIVEAIALVHRAGGSAYLAHPLLLEPDPARLESLLPSLKTAGLDGIEALYSSFSPDDQALLSAMASRHGLLICAGSDFHHHTPDGRQPPIGIDMPAACWKPFRDAVFSNARHSSPPPDDRTTLLRPRNINFILRIVIPAIIAMILFAVAMVDVVLPAIERSLMDRKREMIRELVNSAWGILVEAEEEARLGLVTPEQTRDLAKKRIATLRYGREGKDYFWLQDMHPTIVMHPYRTELEGHDVSDFRDPRGVRIFVEFANLVRRQNEGFINYVWQWKDDPHRLVPKESYIRGFKPWGWIIGTGIYTEDVKAEIARFERHLNRILVGIAILIALMLLTVIRQSLNLERKRRDAEDGLHEANERYRTLVEAAREGTLLLIDLHCRYANPTLLRWLGYTAREIELLDLSDLIPVRPENNHTWSIIHRIRQGSDCPDGIEALLHHRDGRLLRFLLAFSRISYANRDGLIIHARDITPYQKPDNDQPDTGTSNDNHLADAAANVPVGLFRARALRRASIVEANATAIQLLPSLGDQPVDNPPSLADAFPDPETFNDFIRRLEHDGSTRQRLHPPVASGPARTLTLDARLIRDHAGTPLYIDGRIDDTSADAQRETERDSLIERLQTSLLYLHDPVDKLCHPPAFCTTSTPISEAAALMTAQDSEAALVRDAHGTLAGMVTDRILRARIMAETGNSQVPVRDVMRESVITIPRHALVYEALLLMQDKGVEHVAITDDGGAVVGILHSRDILQLHSSEAAVLTRKIAEAATAAEAIHWCRRTPVLVSALQDSGAHPRQVTRMITAIGDAATRRFLELAELALGPAPCPYVFLALGSQGRREMSLFADQDNGILYDPPREDSSPEMLNHYFLDMGKQVCSWLNDAGYPFCRGAVMANNPKWCAPLSLWQQNISGWIRQPEPQQVLEFTVFLDFRPVHGKEELARTLRRYVHKALQENPAFLPFLARDLLRFRPPATRLRHRLQPWKTSLNILDMKAIMMPLSGMARLYALHHNLDETHTLDRLEALTQRALLSGGNWREIATAYELLLRLRLNHQAECLREGRPLDNIINWQQLSRIEQSQLDQAIHRIVAIQKKVSYDFLGGT